MSSDSEERYVRACERHLAPLTDMRCPGRDGRGAHYCKTWVVVDRHTGRVLNRADVDGHREELNVPVNALKAAEKNPRKTPQLAAKKLGKGDHVLWIRLVLSQHGDTAHRYRVCWQLIKGTGRGGGADERGTSVACPDEKAGRVAFEREVSTAKTAGFVELPSVGQARRLVFKPMPLALTAAASRPKS